jgi:hypothetical protein
MNINVMGHWHEKEKLIHQFNADILSFLQTPLLNPKEIYKNLPSKRPMGYDKGVLWEFKTGFT